MIDNLFHNMGLLLGFRVVVSNDLGNHKQFRFPRTKNRRIRKKWAKRSQNYKFFESSTVLVDDQRQVIYCSSRQLDLMKKAIAPPLKESDRPSFII